MLSVPSLFLHQYSDHLHTHLDAWNREDWRTVDRGYSLFQEHAVHSMTYTKNTIDAIVQDLVPARVTLHTDLFHLNECTCMEKNPCHHMVAVFFQMYSERFRVNEWLEDWRGKAPPPDEQKEDTVMNKVDADDLYDKWTSFADEIFENEIFKKKSIPPYLLNMYGLMALKKLETPPPGNPHPVLYQIVVHTRFLENLLQWFVSSRYSYQEIEDTCQQVMQSIFSNLEFAIHDLPSPLPLQYDPICEKLRHNVREWLFLQGAFDEKVLRLYWLLWRYLFTNRTLREEELAFARKTVQMASSDSSWRVAYSFLLFLSNHVEAALEELKPAGGRHLNYMIEYIDYFADHEDWGKIQEIAPFFINHVKNHIEKMRLHERHQFVTMADTIFYQVSIHSKDASLHERLLLEMLPYSRSELKHLYFMTKQYAKLMEFLAITQMEPGRDILQLVQKEAPERLLPYYHQLVMEAIARKNRKSYKEAVRYLKKLRTIYKKLKRQDTWQQFFDLLMQETKRLRAFQEECQRGKLIHAETKTV